MTRKKRPLRYLSKNWLDKISEEEIIQEELIQLWKHPELEGYQGLLSYNELLYSTAKLNKVKSKETKLKKNIPAKLEAGIPFIIIEEFLKNFDRADRAKVSFLIQGAIQEIITGVKYSSLRDLASLTNVSKSALSRLKNHLLQKDFLDR